MLDLITRCFDTTGFPARWDCGTGWTPLLGGLHIGSDLVIFSAYMAVPGIALWHTRHRVTRLNRMFWVFLTLIFVSCGMVHLVEAAIFEWPIYRFSALLKFLTALVSAGGAILLYRTLPAALDLRPREDLEREIAGREHAEALLEQERFLLDTLMTHLPDAIYFKDVDGRYRQISRGMADRLGVAHSRQAVGLTDVDFFPADYAARAAADEQRVMETGTAIVGKSEQPTWPNGEKSWVLTTKTALKDRDGQTIGIVGISHDITAQKRAEERLSEVIQAAPNAIFIVDEAGCVTLANRVTEEMFDCDAPSLIGAPAESLIPGFANLEIGPNDEGPMEVIGLRSSGTRFPLDLGLSAIHTDEGELILASGTDASRRKSDERSLRESEERFDLAVRGSTDGIWDWDVRTDVVYYAPRFKQLIGYEDDEMENLFAAWREKLHPDDEPITMSAIEAHLVRHEPYDVEYRLKTKSGQYRWFRARGQAQWDENGRAVRMSGSITEIHQRKEAEDELRASEARYKTMIEHAPEAIVMLDCDEQHFVDANQRAEELFGMSHADLVRVHPVDVSPEFQPNGGSSKEMALEYIGRALGGETVVFDWVHQRADGVNLDCEVRLVRLPARGRNVVRASITDITWRKRIEDELRIARDEAEAASRSKSEFLANMSHEIRTPMNAIIGMTELVLDSELGTTQRDFLNTVLESAESLLAVINEVLDFSKIESGRLELDEAPFDVRDEVGDAVKSLGLRAAEKGLELACRIDAEVPDQLFGDSGRVRQILVNLIGNAIKFTAHGEVVVDVSSHRLDQSQCELHLSVRDTGIGIAPEHREQIFQAFEQADTSTTRRFGGTGLGLAIVKRIVDRLGGHITVESTVDVGSEFRIVIPFHAVESPPTTMSLPEELFGLPVLVVDDNATNRRILVETLRQWHLEPVAVAGASEALAGFDEIKPALLITDVHMPDLDGYSLIRQLRDANRLRGVGVIVLTSGTRAGDTSLSGALGVSAQLIKPAKQSELLTALLNAVGQSHRTSTETTTRDEPPLPQLKILLAEDGRANRQLAVALLTRWGHIVDVAEDGEAAVDLWRDGDFDLILMDVQMPVMDGLEATRAIRDAEASTGGHIPIVAMTARAMPGDRELCLEAGMDGYIAKPVRRHALYQALAPLFSLGETVDVADNDAEPPRPRHSPVTGINWDRALDNMAGDHGLLQEVMQATRDETPRLLTALETAIAAGDLAESLRLAHTIKGAGRTFASADLQAAAGRIEDAAEAGNAAPIATMLPALREEVRRFLEELEAGEGA